MNNDVYLPFQKINIIDYTFWRLYMNNDVYLPFQKINIIDYTFWRLYMNNDVYLPFQKINMIDYTFWTVGDEKKSRKGIRDKHSDMIIKNVLTVLIQIHSRSRNS